MTPMRPERVAAMAARAPGSMTPRTGNGSCVTQLVDREEADAVLQAMTMSLTP